MIEKEPTRKEGRSGRRRKESFVLGLDELLLVVAAAAGALILVAWEGVAFEALHAVGVEEMRAGEEVDGFAPKRHQADRALLILAGNSPLLHFLPIHTYLHLHLPLHS